jgi:hypothetical protein
MATVPGSLPAPAGPGRVGLALAAVALVGALVGSAGRLSRPTTGPAPTQPGDSASLHEAPASPRPSPTPGPAPVVRGTAPQEASR